MQGRQRHAVQRCMASDMMLGVLAERRTCLRVDQAHLNANLRHGLEALADPLRQRAAVDPLGEFLQHTAQLQTSTVE